MARGKQGHAPCKTSSSKNTYGSQLLWEPTRPKVGVAAPAYHKKRKVYPCILEHARIACSIMGGPVGALGCGLGCEI